MQVLKLATRSSARAIGSPESGAIRAGARADLILFDMDKPHLIPRHDLAANILYSARPGDIDHVIADGRVLLRKGELTTLDEHKILFEAERHARRLVGQEMHRVREYATSRPA
jgi:5-methylthioadenosine/S-adenosylhomocysteine deaminase